MVLDLPILVLSRATFMHRLFSSTVCYMVRASVTRPRKAESLRSGPILIPEASRCWHNSRELVQVHRRPLAAWLRQVPGSTEPAITVGTMVTEQYSVYLRT